jgi:23S rRNA pseudouridine1911/1915/1917 synthase
MISSDDDTPDELVLVIPPGESDRLDKALAGLLPEEAGISRSRLTKMIAAGALSTGGRRVEDGKVKANAGEVYVLRLEEAESVETLAEEIPLVVIYEDDELIVVDKPAGMVVHPAPGSPRGTLVNALLWHCGESLQGIGGERRPGIVHRIDKETSGLLVAAKSDRAHHGLSAQFAAHTVSRRYLAVAHGVPMASDPRLRGLRGVGVEAGGILRIMTEIARHRTDRQKQAVVWDGAGRHAVTRARVMEELAEGAASLLECWLETGRTHQIRVHMSYAGHGLVGDPVYGGTRRIPEKQPGSAYANVFPRQALHAATLGFDHPLTGERLEFRCDPPEDFQTLVMGLRQPRAE